MSLRRQPSVLLSLGNLGSTLSDFVLGCAQA
jgi:hypothetical protein